MGLSKSLENKKFDSRLIEWNLKNNVISKSEYDQYISSLQDSSNNAEVVDIETEDNDDDLSGSHGNPALF